jgi:hypothetical protein
MLSAVMVIAAVLGTAFLFNELQREIKNNPAALA